MNIILADAYLTLTTWEVLFVQSLVYLGAGVIIYGVFCFFSWIGDCISKRRQYDEQQIDDIIQRAKYQALEQFYKNKRNEE